MIDENKWVNLWEVNSIYKTQEVFDKKKKYILIEFPYPSGDKLHVGHARSYSCLDSVARLSRMKGFEVLFPFGWDAFGLPAENYAIKTGIHPSVTTKTNIEYARKQAISWGLSFDWTREINTSDPEYYKWTQWIFIQLFKKGLAYKQEIPVNWCPSCKINLANEEVVDGKCERCGTETERRRQSQWLLKITAYADRLLDDLKTVNYRSDIAAQQVNWIGKKEGARVKFEILNSNNQTNSNVQIQNLEVFTTRLDTIFGTTFLVIAPEMLHTISKYISNDRKTEVEDYCRKALNKSERERKQKSEKSGVNTGVKVINPANRDEIPVWVADYVMMDIGTGVVMGVPAHDERDMEFAKKYGLAVREVVAYNGILINSGKYDGMESLKAVEEMTKDGLGELTNHYHLRDWVFSRQHYWGEPIPMIFCQKCGWYPVPEDQLPVVLPPLEKFQPSGTGESPLSQVSEFVNTVCPECGGPAKRETDTMPNWAGSSWYFLRYCDPHNENKLADFDKLKYWLPVDWYNGGMEHTTLHLLYSRFWHKFLFDLGVVPTAEPYVKRTSHGVVLGPDGKKMSKSKGNVINPDDVVNKYGADTLRMYEMFIGPFDQMVAWSWEGVEGVARFLKRIEKLTGTSPSNPSPNLGEGRLRVASLTARIEKDLEGMKFNTVVSAMMEFVNWWQDNSKAMTGDDVLNFAKILAPMAPFLAEEIYQRWKEPSDKFESVHQQKWPEFKLQDDTDQPVMMVVQVDGKLRMRFEMEMEKARSRESVEGIAISSENVKKFLKKDYKTIFVPGKIINFVNK